MPFTPFHFGPSALIGLPLKRWIDIPVFVLANVVIDFEPLAVMFFQPNYPLHGYFHTFLIGGMLGILWGLIAYPLKPVWRFFMGIFGLSYQPTLTKMMISGILGIWLHVFIDSFLYPEMNPFFPIRGNPLQITFHYSRVYSVCEALLIVAVVIYGWLAFRTLIKGQSKENIK
jgi:membrane-bound metal-dependent hydrolase YbcI (DUF457 family)